MSLTNIKAVLVDDEVNALHNLTVLLEEFCPNVTILGKATNIDEAVIIINKEKPDLVFLDIEMPQKSGFELFNETSRNFKTIFVTAYDEYAVKAFEVSALDYLLKPINIDRLQQAVAKVVVQEQPVASLKTLQKNIAVKKIQRINVLYKDVYKELEVNDILCIEANQSYSVIYYENKKYVYSKNLIYFEKLLADNPLFFRTHRSWIVNLSKVKHFSKNKLTLMLHNNIETTVSRRKIKEFQESFNYTI